MKSIFKQGFFVCFLLSSFHLSATEAGIGSDAESEAYDFDRGYFSVAGGVMLPGNGADLERGALVQFRTGWYQTESLAWEIGLSVAPSSVCAHGGNETVLGPSANLLWHLFGYERFDPFVTAGVAALFGPKEVFADSSRRSAIGPEFGIGAFYHLTDSWSLRAEARSEAFLDSPSGVVYALTAGLERSF